MAAANESQGLKIAVAVFIALSVILAVTSYFLYSAVPRPTPSWPDGRGERRALQARRRATRLNQYEEMRGKIGIKAEESTPAKEEISAHYKKIYERLDDLMNAVNAAVQKVQQSGAQGPELEDPSKSPADRSTRYRSRAQQDLYLVARPADRADGEPVAADHRAIAQLLDLRQQPRGGHRASAKTAG